MCVCSLGHDVPANGEGVSFLRTPFVLIALSRRNQGTPPMLEGAPPKLPMGSTPPKCSVDVQLHLTDLCVCEASGEGQG